MGGKTSKEEPTKPISLVGRSSQKSHFQICKLKLNKIQKYLEKFKEGTASQDYKDIKTQLEAIGVTIGNIAEKLKDKHKEKHEQILKHLNETFQKLETKARENDEKHKNAGKPKIPTKPSKIEVYEKEPAVRQPVEANHIQTTSEEAQTRRENAASPDEEKLKEELDKKRRSSVKYGIQVLPKLPPLLKKDSFVLEEEEHSPKKLEGRRKSLDETTAELEEIDKISEDIISLEKQLQFFRGNKLDAKYVFFKECLIQNLTKLDNIEPGEESVLKQEKKLCIQRLERLLQLLDSRVDVKEDMEDVVHDSASEDEEFSDLLHKIEDINMELYKKPVIETRI